MAANPYTTNLELQLDARDITGLSDGDSVTTWADSSAAGSDATQSNASYKPVYKTNIIGTNPVVRFSGSNARSLYGSFSGSWTGYSGATIFMLSQFVEANGASYGGVFNLNYGAGDDAFQGVSITGSLVGTYAWNGSAFGTFANSGAASSGPVGGLRAGEPTLSGIAIKSGSNGYKVISELGAHTTSDSLQILNTPTQYTLAQRYVSGAVKTTQGFRMDVALVLVYKEYMSDDNIALVKNWILTEFDLHTQATGGGGVADLFGGLVK